MYISKLWPLLACIAVLVLVYFMLKNDRRRIEPYKNYLSNSLFALSLGVAQVDRILSKMDDCPEKARAIVHLNKAHAIALECAGLIQASKDEHDVEIIRLRMFAGIMQLHAARQLIACDERDPLWPTNAPQASKSFADWCKKIDSTKE